MTRVLLSHLTVSALAITWHAASAEPAGAPRMGEHRPPEAQSIPPAGSRFEDEPWVALSVSEDGRVLVVQGAGGGCGHDPRATATETASTVEIRVRQLVPADLSAISCPAMARIDTLQARLSAPIAGRPLIGQSLGTATIGLTGPRTVPRVVGLRAQDARFALRAQGFRVRDRLSGVVCGQQPGPQAPVRAGQIIVTLLARCF